MRRYIDRIFNASGEQWIGFLVLCFIASLMVLALGVAFSDKGVGCYYTSTSVPTNSLARNYNVLASVNWAPDPVVFTTSEIVVFNEYLSKVALCK